MRYRAQYTTRVCYACGGRVEEDAECPIAVRITVGNAAAGLRALSEGGMKRAYALLPPFLRALLGWHEPQVTICGKCFGANVQVAPVLVDKVAANAASPGP